MVVMVVVVVIVVLVVVVVVVVVVRVVVKGKAIPLQAWIGPKGSRSSRFTDFKKIGT
jgi:hypothetical protein